MIFFKLEILIFLKKGTHIYDLYYHINNILKKNHMFIFWFRGTLKLMS
jgi:uncharacterized Zn finger protein